MGSLVGGERNLSLEEQRRLVAILKEHLLDVDDSEADANKNLIFNSESGSLRQRNVEDLSEGPRADGCADVEMNAVCPDTPPLPVNESK